MRVRMQAGLPGGSDGKESAWQSRRCKRPRGRGLIPGLGRSPGGGNGNSLQHSCLENPMDRADWWATVHGVTKSRRWLSNLHTYEWCSERNDVSFSWIFAKLLALWYVSQFENLGIVRELWKIRQDSVAGLLLLWQHIHDPKSLILKF